MEFIEKFKRSRLEKNAYRQIVEKQNKAAEREAYAEESRKQAMLRGKRIAIKKYNKPSFSERVKEGIIKNINARHLQIKGKKKMTQVKPYGIKDLI